MTDIDVERLQRQVKELFANDGAFTKAEVQQLVQTRSLNDLAFLVTTLQNEVFAFTIDPDQAALRALGLAGTIKDQLSEPEGAMFDACLAAAFKGLVDHDERVTSRLPDFEYVDRGGGITIDVTFPDDVS